MEMFKAFWVKYSLFCLILLLLGLIIIKQNQSPLQIEVANSYLNNNYSNYESISLSLYLNTEENLLVPLYVEVKIKPNYELPFYHDKFKTAFDKEVFLRYALLTNLANHLPQGLFSPLPKDVELLNYDIEGDTLVLNLGKGFENLNQDRFRVVLGSIVYTFTSISGIRGVKILCEGKPVAFEKYQQISFTKDDLLINYAINGLPYHDLNKYQVYYYLKKADVYYLVPVLIYDNVNKTIEDLLKNPIHHALETFISNENDSYNKLGYYQYYLSLLMNGLINNNGIDEENVIKMINFYEIALN